MVLTKTELMESIERCKKMVTENESILAACEGKPEELAKNSWRAGAIRGLHADIAGMERRISAM
jgi:hypothetical protein